MAKKNKQHLQMKYIEDYCVDSSGDPVKYGNATLAVGIGIDSLEVRVVCNGKTLENTAEEFIKKYDLPEKYKGLKVNYRLMKMPKPRK